MAAALSSVLKLKWDEVKAANSIEIPLIRRTLETFGEIDALDFDRSKGTAIVYFKSEDCAKRARVGLDGKPWNGSNISASFWTPVHESRDVSSPDGVHVNKKTRVDVEAGTGAINLPRIPRKNDGPVPTTSRPVPIALTHAFHHKRHSNDASERKRQKLDHMVNSPAGQQRPSQSKAAHPPSHKEPSTTVRYTPAPPPSPADTAVIQQIMQVLTNEKRPMTRQEIVDALKRPLSDPSTSTALKSMRTSKMVTLSASGHYSILAPPPLDSKLPFFDPRAFAARSPSPAIKSSDTDGGSPASTPSASPPPLPSSAHLSKPPIPPTVPSPFVMDDASASTSMPAPSNRSPSSSASKISSSSSSSPSRPQPTSSSPAENKSPAANRPDTAKPKPSVVKSASPNAANSSSPQQGGMWRNRCFQAIESAGRPLEPKDITEILNCHTSEERGVIYQSLQTLRRSKAVAFTGSGTKNDPYIYSALPKDQVPLSKARKQKTPKQSGRVSNASDASIDETDESAKKKQGKWRELVLKTLREVPGQLSVSQISDILMKENGDAFPPSGRHLVSRVISRLRSEGRLACSGTGTLADPHRYVLLPPGTEVTPSKSSSQPLKEEGEQDHKSTEDTATAEGGAEKKSGDDSFEASEEMKEDGWDEEEEQEYEESAVPDGSVVREAAGAEEDEMEEMEEGEEEGQEEEDEEGAEEFEVEVVLTRRGTEEADNLEYLVKWKDWSSAIWVTADSSGSFAELVTEYESTLDEEQTQDKEDADTEEVNKFIKNVNRKRPRKKPSAELRTLSQPLYNRIDSLRREYKIPSERKSTHAMKLEVSRSEVLEMLIDEAECWEPNDLFKPLRVTFSFEQTEDEDTTAAELFSEFFSQALNSKSGLFESDGDGFNVCQESESEGNGRPRSAFVAFGKVLLKCVIDRYPIPLQLAPILDKLRTKPLHPSKTSPVDAIREGFHIVDLTPQLQKFKRPDIEGVLCGMPITAEDIWNLMALDDLWDGSPAVYALEQAVTSLTEEEATGLLHLVCGMNRLPFDDAPPTIIVLRVASDKRMYARANNCELLVPSISNKEVMKKRLLSAIKKPEEHRLY
mmetsp:Transcript_26151/g.43637  ORF Transcript_26151/g.43637 Transcript_26151/m.43637 type:complete len:1086 (+) Transcript_26151:47-3304(+)